MHKYLRAIGFSEIKKKEFEELLDSIIDKPEMIKVTIDSEGNEFAELSKEFDTNIGLTLRGVYKDDDSFEMEYYCPYFIGTSESTREPIEIEKHSEKESYAGVCDEPRLGVTLIFYIQNVCDYLSENLYSKNEINAKSAYLGALSTEGSIILPIEKKKETSKNVNKPDRKKLIAEAREGNEDAIESLTLEDMDTYNIISRRVANEDILTIVSSYFMPYGIESDQYSVLGDIIDYTVAKNKITGENIVCMKIECNDMKFDVCINEKDLVGQPDIGRRFKGNIWLQGSVYM